MHPLTAEQIKQYHEEGFVIVRGLFSSSEVQPILDACEENPDLFDSVSINPDREGNLAWPVAFWSKTSGRSLLSRLPRTERLVSTAETLLGEECYFWRSRLVRKPPGLKGRVEYHQDYSYWYADGCVLPNLVSCSLAISENTPENGCLQVVPKSHLGGRLDLLAGDGGAEYPEAERVNFMIKRWGVVSCQLQPGDGLFFHSNLLHGSEGNRSSGARVLIHNTYNAASNQPIAIKGQSAQLADSQRYRPIERLPDSFIREGLYEGIFDHETFLPKETDPGGLGIFKRAR